MPPPSAASPGAASPGAASPGAEESPDGQDLAQVVFHRAIRAARGLLTTAAPDSELVAVGASTFGIPHEDKVELAPAIDGWENLALGRELRAAFPDAIIRMATDAKAAAAAEVRWGALHDCDPGMYLNLGTGLSAAIVAGGEVIVGGNGAAGEFGYNLRNVADVGLELSQRTMLEEMVSGLALARRAGGQPGRPPGVTAADVFKAGTGDPALQPPGRRFRRRAGVPPGQPGHPGQPGADRGGRRPGPVLGPDRPAAGERAASRAALSAGAGRGAVSL